MNRRIIVGLFLIITTFSLVLAGCGKEQALAEEPAAGSAGIEFTEDCTFGTVEGCEEGDNLCMYGRCWTVQELFDAFGECDYTDGSAEACQAKPCVNCASGKYSCYSTGSPRGSVDYCAECVMDGHCKSGMTCSFGRCVSEAGKPVDTDVGSGDPILGLWERGGYHYYFKENGDMMLEDSGSVLATWEHVGGNKYVIEWPSYGNIDDMALSDDGNMLTGLRRGEDKEVEFERLE